MKQGKIVRAVVPAVLALILIAAAARKDAAELVLMNEHIRAVFTNDGAYSLLDMHTGNKLRLEGVAFSIRVNGQALRNDMVSRSTLTIKKDRLTWGYDVGGFKVSVVYELQPGWTFLSKQIFVEPEKPAPFRVNEINGFAAALDQAPGETLPLTDGRFGTLLRFAKAGETAPSFGLFMLYQNPYNVWKVDGPAIYASYAPEMDWKPEWGPFASDRLCLGFTRLGGLRTPARAVPEWKCVSDYPKYLAENPLIDLGEAEAVVECVRAFLLYKPTKSIRVHVPWCENDYQIDVSTPEGWVEYTRIIDVAAARGCRSTLFTPANSEFSSLLENRDAWGWENLLFFSLGQKLRNGEWIPSRDPVPPSLREKIDYGRSKGLNFVAYAYPSLPFRQDPAWTKWAGDKLGGYNAVDTGLRSFQDWWIQTLVDFVKKTGAAGYSFDHWWIAYDNPAATSKYAQWFGARRILEELRRRGPDVIIDGRQQYMSFGPWTWLAGSYPHPTLTDEQPESFVAFPDLHTDRVSADRQRYAAWKYRVERFAPPEIMPGFITHQTERTDGNKIMRRDRFRPRDWDVLGWKYSLISSIGTAPFNHVVDFIPARDEAEFKALSEEDKAFFRGWLDWTDKNAEVLRKLKPIIGQPMIGRVDGTAAAAGDKGFVFLFNPNYRRLEAEFRLDDSIGLSKGTRFVLKELFPEEGKLVGKPNSGFWEMGDKVVYPMRATESVVLEIAPAPEAVKEPLLFGATGLAVLKGDRLDRNRLIVEGIRGEPGTERDILVVLPPRSIVADLNVNGGTWPYAQGNKPGVAVDSVGLTVRFDGYAFGRGETVFAYDPKFAGGRLKGGFKIPMRIFNQLLERKKKWPVPYTEDDLLATWLGSDRLLLYIQIAEPEETMAVSMTIDGKPVEVKKAYNSIYGHAPKRTFLGFYADVSTLKPDTEYRVELTLPSLAPGRFQGLFFENVEPEYTTSIK